MQPPTSSPTTQDAVPSAPGAGRATVVAGATALATGALLFGGATAGPLPYAIGTLIVQLALATAWYLVASPPGLAGAAVVGALTAVAADAVTLVNGSGEIGPLVAVLAGAFGATTVAQLSRGIGRRNVTEAFGATLTIAVAETALASTIMLRRGADADWVTVIVLTATGGVLLARLVDLVLPRPAAHPEVPRGVPGLLLGSLLGAGVGVLWSAAKTAGTAGTAGAAMAGVLIATVAVLADLGVDYARAGRLAAGTAPSGGLVGATLGPLIGLAVAAPIGYLVTLVH